MNSFDNWRTIFIVALNDKNQPIEDHLKTCTQYINEIIENNFLLLPNTGSTESFLKDTLVPAIRQILKFNVNFSTKNKANPIMTFLKSCLGLFPWAYLNDRIDIFPVLNEIMDPNQNFYKTIKSAFLIQPSSKNSKRNQNKYVYTPTNFDTKNPLFTLYDYFISHELFTVMSIRFQKNDEIPLLLEHLDFFLHHFNKMSEKVSENITLSLLYNFFNFFEFYMNANIIPAMIKSIDQRRILSIFTLILELANKYEFEVPDSTLQLIFNYGYSQIQNKNLHSQLFGTSIFKIFTESTNRSLTFFSENIKSTNFVTDFMSRDLHNDVISNTIPILTKMSSLKCIKLNDLKQICIVAKNAHNTQKEKMINLTVDLLLELPFPDVSDFFNSIIDESFDYLQLLSSYLTKKKDIPLEMALDFVTKIMTIGSNIYAKSKSDGNNAIKNIIRPIYSTKYKKNILTNCFSVLMNEYNPFLIALLGSIATSYSATIRADFNNEIYDRLCFYLTSLDTQQRSIVFPLVYLISRPLQRKIPVSLLKAIMCVNDNNMWSFFSCLLLQSGMDAFEKESVTFLADTITTMKKMPESREFAEFFKLYMLLYNILDYKINVEKTRNPKVIPTKYSVKQIPLNFEDKLLEQILTFETQEVSSISCQTLIDIYSQLEFKSSSCDIFNQLIEMATTDEQIIRVVNLVYEFCSKNDKESVSQIITHSFNNKIYNSELKSPITLRVRFELNTQEPLNKEIMTINVSKDTPIQIIMTLLAPNLPEGQSKYMVTLNGIEKYNGLVNYQNGFSNSKFVDIKSRVGVNKSILTLGNPSEYLRNLRFTEKLIRYLKENEIPAENSNDSNDQKKKKKKTLHDEKVLKNIWRLLCYLPSDEGLIELSSKPQEFVSELQEATNKYYIRYLYQILLWRLRSKRYEGLYSNVIQPVLIDIVNQDELAAFCADEIVRLLEIYPSPEFIIPALKILANKDIKDPTKYIASSILAKFNFDITSIAENKSNVDLIMKAISIMPLKVWTEFRVFLYRIKNDKILYSMSINALTKNLPNSQFFTEIFSTYLPNFLAEDSSRQISLCLKLMKENPSIGLAKALNDIITHKISSKSKNTESLAQTVDQITSVIEICNDSEVLKKLFDSISKINSYDPSSRSSIDNFINKVNIINIDRWSFSPELHSGKFRGLRNLQATCYMNSDLQQLYHIPAFRYLISKADTKDLDEDKKEFLTSLQFLMDDMTLMKTRYCDTETFFYAFSKLHGGMFETNEQQDAQEFFTFFFDDIPEDSKRLFEGIMIDTITEKSDNINANEKENNENDNDENSDGAGGGVIQHREQSFLSLSLPILEVDDMNESLRSILQNQVLFGDNQYQLPNGTKIDAIKSQRIKVAPPVLIIQLKRFEYNMTMTDRIKINKKFEILKKLSLKELMTNETKNDSDYNYTLHGVVVHRGEGSHGHYTSLVDIDNDWYRFDDIDVQKVTEEVYRQEAFGQSEEELRKNNNRNDDFEIYMMSNISGYLLFYINDDAKVDGKSLLDKNFDIFIPEEKKQSIEMQNKSYLFEQLAFLEPTFYFFNEISTPAQLRDYFFNVFSHSKQNAAELSLLIIERMKELYNTSALVSELVQWMCDNFREKVLEIYVHCSVMDIVHALTELILFSCSKVTTEESGGFIGTFIIELQQMIPKWRQISEVCKMIIKYLQISPENVKFAQNNGWSDLIMLFIYEVFNGSRSDNALKLINITEIFEIAKLIVSFEFRQNFVDLLNIREMVSKSHLSYNAYKSLLVKCTALDIFDVSQMAKIIPEEFSKPKVMEMYLQKVEPSTFEEIVVKQLENEMKYNRYLIMGYFISKKSLFKNILIANPEYLIDSLLMTDVSFNDLCTKTEQLMIDIYEDKEINIDIKKDVLNKMINIIPSLKNRKDITKMTPFLHVLLILMKITNFPRNSHIKGLEDLKTDSEYMLAISAYSNSSHLISIFETKAKKQLSNGITGTTSVVSANKFISDFTAVLESASDDVFMEIINRSEWNNIISKFRSTTSSYDLIQLQNLVSLVIKKNSSFLAQQPIPEVFVNDAISFIVKILTNNGSCEPSYSSHFARFLPSFIDDVRDPKAIEILLNVVSNVFEKQNLPAKPRDDLVQTYFVSIPVFMYKHTNTSRMTNMKVKKEGSEEDILDQKVPDEEAKKFIESFKNLTVGGIEKACIFISEQKRENSLITMDLLLCIASFNEFFLDSLKKFALNKINTISLSTRGAQGRTIDNHIMAALLFQLMFLSPKMTRDSIDQMVEIYKKASQGYQAQGKRETMFLILNRLQNENQNRWAAMLAKEIFVPAKFEKEEEKSFFRMALKKLKDEEAMPLIKTCAEEFNLIKAVQSSSAADAAAQLEKIALLVEIFGRRIKREDILANFMIDKSWKGQSDRHEKAIVAIFGEE